LKHFKKLQGNDEFYQNKCHPRNAPNTRRPCAKATDVWAKWVTSRPNSPGSPPWPRGELCLPGFSAQFPLWSSPPLHVRCYRSSLKSSSTPSSKRTPPRATALSRHPASQSTATVSEPSQPPPCPAPSRWSPRAHRQHLATG
jgi:hypothetical protein